MNFFQKNPLKNLIVICSMLALFLLASCGQKDDATAAPQNAQLSGQEIYKSVFFAQGELAKELDSYKTNVDAIADMPATQRADFEKNIDALVASIEKASPEFFETFKEEILSKDHRRIEKAIVSGGELMYEHLQIIYPNIGKVYDKIEEDFIAGKISTDGEIDRDKIEGQLNDYQELLTQNMITSDEIEVNAACSWVLVCVAYFVIAAHNHVAVAAVVAVAAAVTVKIGVRATDAGSEDMLAFEMLVHELATVRQ